MSDRPPLDITPDVRDGARRLTYGELAAVRGISRASAERLVRRKRWPRQIGNDGIVRAIVPLAETAPDSASNGADSPPGHPPPDSPDSAPAVIPDIMGVIREVVTPLTEQLARERERVDRAERKVEQLELALADARTAERIAAREAAALRAADDQRRAWSWWRRVCWAIRPRTG
jgi:hypothetical protein